MVSPRIQSLNKQPVFKGGYVLYLLKCIRMRNSPAFSFASERANAAKVPLIAVHIYVPDRHNIPQRAFLLEGLKELKESMKEVGAKLLCVKADSMGKAGDIALQLSDNAVEVVLDAGYLRHDRDFEEKLNDALIERCRKLTRVEGNVSVPVTLASDKVEFGARTLRPKVWQHVKAMLKEEWKDTPNNKCGDWKKLVKGDISEMNIEEELKKAQAECKSDSGLTGGEKVAQRMLDFFISNRLVNYHPGRNIPGSKYQSLMSPYLHFGMISTIDIIKRAKEGSAPKHPIDSFIEELLVRRDLAHNFVYYARDNYDSVGYQMILFEICMDDVLRAVLGILRIPTLENVETIMQISALKCLPDWCKKTLKEHKDDKRDYNYSFEQLENGRTHDIFWNACQLEMVHTNKMHGYMRMYWGKKVVEWTPNYETALRFLLEQNDKHELDGRDPNGYTGVLWIFGMHDRAHAERAVFGKLRWLSGDSLYSKYRQTIGDYVKMCYKLAGRKLDGPVGPPKKMVKPAVVKRAQEDNQKTEKKAKPGTSRGDRKKKRTREESEEEESTDEGESGSEEEEDWDSDDSKEKKTKTSKVKAPVKRAKRSKAPAKGAMAEPDSDDE